MLAGARDYRLRSAIVLAGGSLGGSFNGPAASLLFVHGDQDPVVTYPSAQAVYAQLPWPKAFLTVVNGDHGSRIAAHFPNGINLRGGVLTDTDYRDTFSTLYAIKAPGVQPGYVQRPAPLVSLLDHYLGGEPLSEQNSCRVFLISGDARSVLTKVEPRFCAREENAASEGDHD